MFKFELGQAVYYLQDNKVHCAYIQSRMCVENEHDEWAHTKKQKEVWQPWDRQPLHIEPFMANISKINCLSQEKR